METAIRELEGTWEEVAAHAPELAGRRVILTVLPETAEPEVTEHAASFRPASGRSLLGHVGTWEGDDLQECLEAVIASRSQVTFDTE